MKAPSNLNAAGKRAWAEGVATLEALGEGPDLSVGTLERYARASALESSLDAAWRRAGSPATTPGGRLGDLVLPHPLLDQIRRARAQAQDLAGALGLDPAGRRALARPGAGRPAGAASAPDRVAPPRRRLRMVKAAGA